MSHSEFYGNTTFIFDGGYDGEVEIIANERSVMLPVSHLLGFVADYIRMEKITKLEDATDDEIFGIKHD